MQLFLFAFLAALAMDADPGRTVALTFDDLPAAGTTRPDDARRINRGILLALKHHRAPAVGFVNEQKVERLGSGSLKGWRQAGNSLGNHTYSHPDYNDITTAEFESEVIRGEASLNSHPRGPHQRWFRFPYNHAGETPEKQSAAAQFLASRGYRIATCTIDNEDYEWSRAYNLMPDKQSQEARRLQAEYVRYTASKIDYYSDLHVQVFGHEIPHVMLLHANQLNADTSEQILDSFQSKHYRFVTLETAQSDPAYGTPVPQAIKFGQMWGYRWATALGVKVDGRREPAVPTWVMQYGK